ncbi:MAG TPA: hypothetical protein VFK02_17940 [Kofleriaceae bacterium]|nr:hypothetical protein [Kofleriaceae bacterium]
MRWCGLVLALAACSGDPSLDVSVHHPAGYDVSRTRVTVYFGGDVSCNEIAYGDRTDAELAAITVDEVDVTHGGHIEVSRLGGKSIVARGYDAGDRFVTAGCVDLGEVAGDLHRTIETQPTAVVAIDPGQPERPFSERMILITMADIHGVPIEGTVSWLLTGPAGAPIQQPSAGVATRSGEARIHVDDLGTPGPEGLRIRVPWAIAPLPLVTGFDLSRATTIPLDAGGSGLLPGHPSCDVRGHAGKLPTLVCLTPPVLGHRDALEIAWQTDHYGTRSIAIPGAIDNQFALFVDHDGSADEPVWVISADATGVGNWYRLEAQDSGTAVKFQSAVQNVVYVPQCRENSAMPLVGVETGAGTVGVLDKVAFFTATGSQISAPVDGEVLTGGCMDDVDAKEHQAVVVSGSGGDAALVLVTLAGQMQPIPGTKLTGSGFVSAQTQGVIEKRLAGTRLQASGTVVFEAVLAAAGASYKLVERTEVEAAAPPNKIVGGRLDQDDGTDLMWDMSAVRRRLFQVALSEQVGGAPLTAITSGPSATPTTSAATADFLVGDLDGQSTDEIIVFTDSAVTIYSAD